MWFRVPFIISVPHEMETVNEKQLRRGWLYWETWGVEDKEMKMRPSSWQLVIAIHCSESTINCQLLWWYKLFRSVLDNFLTQPPILWAADGNMFCPVCLYVHVGKNNLKLVCLRVLVLKFHTSVTEHCSFVPNLFPFAHFLSSSSSWSSHWLLYWHSHTLATCISY